MLRSDRKGWGHLLQIDDVSVKKNTLLVICTYIFRNLASLCYSVEVRERHKDTTDPS